MQKNILKEIDEKIKEKESELNQPETVSDFLEKERKIKIYSVVIALFAGSFGFLRFYQKRFSSGIMILLGTIISHLLLNSYDEPILMLIGLLLSLSIFGLVIYDVVQVFKNSKERTLEKYQEMKLILESEKNN